MNRFSWRAWRFSFLVLAALAPAAFAASIAVDVGHYHEAPGATSARGVPEFEYNLRLAREIAEALRRRGHETRLIGDDGLASDLYGRAPRAAGMDLLISIHHDSVQAHFLWEWVYEGATRYEADGFSGYSVFVSRRNSRAAESLKCASAIGREMRRAGFKPSCYHADPVLGESRPFADEVNGVHYFDNLVVLRAASIPALLFEAGVIVNREEELRLRDPVMRSRMAAAIAFGADDCLRRAP